MATRSRLDVTLVDRGLFPTRRQAQTAIMAGEIRDNERSALKASDSVLETDEIGVISRVRYVGRGGIKLEGALDAFQIHCEDRVALDIGASTGGFTDCLLQHGARKVFAVDVGKGQLDWKIRSDPRVVTLEKINARHLSREQVPEPVSICVIDVSFISLTLVLPPAFELLTPKGMILALIKPQFELARGDVGRGGIVRSPELHLRAQEKVAAFAITLGAEVQGISPSVITGSEGNQEFFICLQKPSE